MTRTVSNIVFVIALTTVSMGEAIADSTWSRFRGPNGSGVAEDCFPPAKPGQENLAWKVEMAPGLSSPVLWGRRLFLTAVEDERLVTVALDRETGERMWRKEAPRVPLEKVHKESSPAASSPLVDAERVYVYFGSFGLLSYDHDGNELWQKPIPTPRSLYGMSTSPIDFGENLILVLDNDENLPDSKLSQSKIVAFSKATAEIAWETPRPFHRSGWSTPMIWSHKLGQDLVVLGNNRASGYDPVTGAEKWFVTGFSKETIALPVAGPEHVYFSAAQLGGGADEQPDPEPFWKALLQFDENGDGKIERKEMTGHFTFPLRPELPLGHPGYGIPMPSDPEKKNQRLDGMLSWVDKDKDGAWSKQEWVDNMSSRRGRPILMAIRPGGTGDVSDSHVVWEARRNIPEIPSPLYFQNRIYLVRNGGLLAAMDARDGSTIYRERLSGTTGQYSASPVLAGGNLYLLSNTGQISVVKASGEYSLEHQIDLAEPGFVTPAIDADSIYFRTARHLWAFRSTEDKL